MDRTHYRSCCDAEGGEAHGNDALATERADDNHGRHAPEEAQQRARQLAPEARAETAAAQALACACSARQLRKAGLQDRAAELGAEAVRASWPIPLRRQAVASSSQRNVLPGARQEPRTPPGRWRKRGVQC